MESVTRLGYPARSACEGPKRQGQQKKKKKRVHIFAEKAGNANSCPPGLNLELHFLNEGLTGGSVVKNLPANAGDMGYTGSIPGLGRSPGRRHGNHSSILA